MRLNEIAKGIRCSREARRRIEKRKGRSKDQACAVLPLEEGEVAERTKRTVCFLQIIGRK
jgi:hypothetical protein